MLFRYTDPELSLWVPLYRCHPRNVSRKGAGCQKSQGPGLLHPPSPSLRQLQTRVTPWLCQKLVCTTVPGRRYVAVRQNSKSWFNSSGLRDVREGRESSDCKQRLATSAASFTGTSLVPRLLVGGEKRAWYLLFVHARNYPLLNTCSGKSGRGNVYLST